MLLGGNVTRTISSGIANTATFASTPAVFMFGARMVANIGCSAARGLLYNVLPAGSPVLPNGAPPTLCAIFILAGMLAAETGSMIWLLLATYLEVCVTGVSPVPTWRLPS